MIRALRWIIFRCILRKDPASKLIIMGDFNNHLPKVKEMLTPLRLTEVVHDGIDTHNRGNQLDQMFTNLELASQPKLVRYEVASDHDAIIADLYLEGESGTKCLDQQDTFFTQGDVRLAWTKETALISRLRSDPHIWKNPVKDVLMPKLPKRRVLSHFWKPVPEWYCNGDKSNAQVIGERNLNNWRNKIRQLEKAVAEKNLKLCKQLIQQITKFDTGGAFVKSLLMGEGEA